MIITAKTSFFLPINFPYFNANRILFNYVIDQPKKQIICRFLQIAQKKSKVFTLDISFLKNILKSDKAKAEKKDMKIEYNILMANST